MSDDIIKYNGTPINMRDKELNLTDMWRAAGADTNQQPAEWLRQTGTKRFRKALSETLGIAQGLLVRTIGGRNGGTWAHWQICLAYAHYLDAKFYIWCNDQLQKLWGSDAGIAEVASTPKMTDSQYHETKEHIFRLVAQKRITPEGGDDRITLALARYTGFNIAEAPSVTYITITPSTTVQAVPENSVVQPAKDFTGYVSMASWYFAPHKVPEFTQEDLTAAAGLKENLAKYVNALGRKINEAATKDLGLEVMRSLGIYPLTLRSGKYVVTDEIKKNCVGYSKVRAGSINEMHGDTQVAKDHAPHAVFTRAAILKASEWIEKEIPKELALRKAEDDAKQAKIDEKARLQDEKKQQRLAKREVAKLTKKQITSQGSLLQN